MRNVTKRYLFTAILVVVAASMYKDFGWLTIIYLPVWAFLMYAYRD